MEKRTFRVLVPLEFQQAYYVLAHSAEEAMELVQLDPDEARARGAEITSCESEFVASMETEIWEVEEAATPLILNESLVHLTITPANKPVDKQQNATSAVQKRLYCVVVPQESTRTYFVTARSDDEAIELVNMGADEARARGCELEWCDQGRVPLDLDTWQVEVVEPSSTSEPGRKHVLEGPPRDNAAEPSAKGEAQGGTKHPAGLTRGNARLLSELRMESWDLNELTYFVLDTLIDEYLSQPQLFFDQWSEYFEYLPNDPRAALDRLGSWLELHQRAGPQTGEEQTRKERIAELSDGIRELLASQKPEHAAHATHAAGLLTQAFDIAENEGRTIEWTELERACEQAREALGEAFTADLKSETHEKRNEPTR